MGIGVPESRQGQVRSWSEMGRLLDQFDLGKAELKFARYYFNAEKFLAEGRYVRARRRFNALRGNQRLEFEKFEDEHPFVLKMIDIAVKGKSRQNDF